MRAQQWLDGSPKGWTEQDRSEVERHFVPAVATLLSQTDNRGGAVIRALVRWLFDDDDDAQDDDEEDVKDKEEALCVLGPGLLLTAAIASRGDCPRPELCGEQCDEPVLAVSRRLWARVLVAAAAAQDKPEGKSAAVVLLGGILLMFRQFRHTGAAQGQLCCTLRCVVHCAVSLSLVGVMALSPWPRARARKHRLQRHS
jgi:hypothetical protein